jgi:hypothetical protein
MSQWSRGMSMVGDMFNKQLQSKLDALCTDSATHLDASSNEDSGVHPTVDEVSYRSMSALRNWWLSGLGRPGAVGTQNDLRYAVFPETRRWYSTTMAPSRLAAYEDTRGRRCYSRHHRQA